MDYIFLRHCELLEIYLTICLNTGVWVCVYVCVYVCVCMCVCVCVCVCMCVCMCVCVCVCTFMFCRDVRNNLITDFLPDVKTNLPALNTLYVKVEY